VVSESKPQRFAHRRGSFVTRSLQNFSMAADTAASRPAPPLRTMDAYPVQLARTELAFLHRLLLDLQRQLEDGEPETVAALELALAMLRWEGEQPPELEAQVGLGAAVMLKLGPDAMCAWRQWRDQCRKRAALTP
jgi:hypothetical protein